MLARVEGQGEQPGAVRTARTRGGQEQVERLEEIHPSERSYRYTIVSTPMPLKNYAGEFRVDDNHDGTSTVVWKSDFEVNPNDKAKTVAMVQGFLDAGLESVRKQYSSGSTGSAGS
jgi:mxaD protein